MKSKYPNPTTFAISRLLSSIESIGNRVDNSRYCAGGAFLRSVRISPSETELTLDSFPPIPRLADVLREVNPKLDYSMSNYFAVRIISANDGANFDRAWKFLDKALTYRQSKIKEIIKRFFLLS